MRTQQRNLTAADVLAGLAEEARNNNLVASIDWRTFKIKDAAGNPLEPEQAGAVVCTNATGPVLVTLDEHDDVASIMDFDEENVIYTDDGRPLIADLGLAKHFTRSVIGAREASYSGKYFSRTGSRLTRNGTFRTLTSTATCIRSNARRTRA